MIKKVHLVNFRSFKNKSLGFSPETTIIVGPNASGKTNVLESIFLLSTGKSFRAKVETEMLRHGIDVARISGELRIKNYELGNTHNTKYVIHNTALEVVLTRGLIDIGSSTPEKAWPAGRQVARKKMLVNGIARRLVDFAGNLKVVLFGPWDLDLVTESPSLRRKFLDTVLSQVDREYRRASLSYENGVRQRNRLLWQIRENPSAGSGRMRLLFWNQLLIKNGDYISQKREEFIEFANAQESLKSTVYSLEYDKSAISEGRLEQYAGEEVMAATTLVGPHRDDIIFKSSKSNKGSKGIKSRELARYGSRGEQRMGVLWLKLAELKFVEEATRLRQGFGEARPTLLLDDIFSELDHEHRKIVMEIIMGKPGLRQSFGGQVIVSTADPHFIENFKGVEKIELKS